MVKWLSQGRTFYTDHDDNDGGKNLGVSREALDSKQSLYRIIKLPICKKMVCNNCCLNKGVYQNLLPISVLFERSSNIINFPVIIFLKK